MNEINLPDGYVPLTPQEISRLRIKIGKGHRSDKDWDSMLDILAGKCVFTACPMDKLYEKLFSVEGILKDEGRLILFTSIELCTEYLSRHGTQRFGRYMSIGSIPLETVERIAIDNKLQCLIDPDKHQAGQILGIDGKEGQYKVFRLLKP